MSNSKSNYEIISLCDIKELNKKIDLLKKSPWSQLTMPETLNIPKDKPPIKSISKIYITVKIDSLKIIETPRTPISNSEGLFLTGRKLLVEGTILKKVIYNSSRLNKSLNSIEFKIPLSTYVVINHDVDIHNDKFTVKTCIEGFSSKIINERTIFQSTTLFLFASRISFELEPTKPNPDIIYNKIIINNNYYKEVATILFDLINKTILVESTGEIANESLGSREYFSLSLRSSDNYVKAFSSLEADSDASTLYNDLNNKSFNFTDYIELKYIDNLRVSITNSENKNHTFNPNSEQTSEGLQSFYITEQGLKDI